MKNKTRTNVTTSMRNMNSLHIKTCVLSVTAAFCIFLPASFAADAQTNLPSQLKLPPIAEGPFKADWNSLTNYQTPEWFRDAKFGIWAHWGPQCEPEHGDWYARSMYEGPGSIKLQPAYTRIWKLRPSLDQRFQGCDPSLESGAL